MKRAVLACVEIRVLGMKFRRVSPLLCSPPLGCVADRCFSPFPAWLWFQRGHERAAKREFPQRSMCPQCYCFVVGFSARATGAREWRVYTFLSRARTAKSCVDWRPKASLGDAAAAAAAAAASLFFFFLFSKPLRENS